MDSLVLTCILMNISRMASPTAPNGTTFLVSLLFSSRSHFIQSVPNQCLLTLTFLSGDAKNLLLLLVLLAALFRKYVVKNKFRKSALCDVTKESKPFLGFTLALPVHILFHLSEADLAAPKHVEGLAKKITFGRKQKLIVFARDCQQGVK